VITKPHLKLALVLAVKMVVKVMLAVAVVEAVHSVAVVSVEKI
jgi:hypothetical protein